MFEEVLTKDFQITSPVMNRQGVVYKYKEFHEYSTKLNVDPGEVVWQKRRQKNNLLDCPFKESLTSYPPGSVGTYLIELESTIPRREL